MDKIKDLDTYKKIKRAKIHLLMQNNFYGSNLAKFSEQENSGIQTACIDTVKKVIHYNPVYFSTLSHENIINIMAHEISHYLFKDDIRCIGHNFDTWNQASDYIINHINKDIGIMPEGLLHNPEYNPKNYSIEGLYKKLSDTDTDTEGDTEGEGDSDTDTDTEGEGEGEGGYIDFGGSFIPINKNEISEIEAERNVEIMESIKAVQGLGSGIPEDLKEYITKQIEPVIRWEDLLDNFISSNCQDDYSFSRPSNRSTSDFILPGVESDGFKLFVWVTDSSASMDREALDAAISELKALKSQYDFELIHIECSDVIKNVARFDRFQDLEITVSPGGGTDLRPAFDYIDSISDEISGVLVFSDMQLDKSELPANCFHETLFIQFGSFGYLDQASLPFGRLAKMDS